MRAAGAPGGSDLRPAVLGAIAAGGVLGAEARLGAGQLWPGSEGFPWATLVVNVTGCLLIGAVAAVLVTRIDHPLVRPFVTVGVLGGYTTFSGYTVDTVRLLTQDRPIAAAAYAAGTLLLAIGSVIAGGALTRAMLRAAGGSADRG